MLENRTKFTTTSTGSPYTPVAITNFPSLAVAFDTDEPVDYFIELSGGAEDGDWEAGSGYVNGSGNLVVDRVKTTFDASTATLIRTDWLASPPTAITKTNATTIICFITPMASRFLPLPNQLPSAITVANEKIIFNGAATGWATSSYKFQTTSRVQYHPWWQFVPGVADGISYRGTGAGGNFNIGFYSDDDGPARKLIETGSIVVATGDVYVSFLSSATLRFHPGLFWVAIVHDDAGNLYKHNSWLSGVASAMCGGAAATPYAGFRESVSGVTLPANATTSGSYALASYAPPGIGLRMQ